MFTVSSVTVAHRHCIAAGQHRPAGGETCVYRHQAGGINGILGCLEVRWNDSEVKVITEPQREPRLHDQMELE